MKKEERNNLFFKFTIMFERNPIHESHTEMILKTLWYDKWIHRDILQKLTHSKNLTARITRARTIVPKTSTIICLQIRGKLFKFFKPVTDTYYAVVARDLLDNPNQTTYEVKNLPKAVSELLGEPKKLRFTKIFFK